MVRSAVLVFTRYMIHSGSQIYFPKVLAPVLVYNKYYVQTNDRVSDFTGKKP